MKKLQYLLASMLLLASAIAAVLFLCAHRHTRD